MFVPFHVSDCKLLYFKKEFVPFFVEIVNYFIRLLNLFHSSTNELIYYIHSCILKTRKRVLYHCLAITLSICFIVFVCKLFYPFVN